MALRSYTQAADASLHFVTDQKLRHAFGRAFHDVQRRVDNGEVTVVVLAARRMASIYMLLLTHGMPALRGCEVVMDRVLEADPNWPGKNDKVLVLDDTVLLGTTLRELGLHISRKRADFIGCAAVAEDHESSRMLLDAARCSSLERRSSEQLAVLSKQLVAALFDATVPYFSDFAYTTPLLVDAGRWVGLLGAAGWRSVDVTAPFGGYEDLTPDARRSIANAESFSLIPDADTAQRILSKLPPLVASLVDSLKLRLFTRRLGSGRRRLVVLPLGLVSPAYPDELLAALEEIADHIHHGRDEVFGIGWRNWSPVAWHRLLQLYVSACILVEFWPNLHEHAGAAERVHRSAIEQMQLDLYFGSASNSVLDAFDSVVDRYVEQSPNTGTVARVPHPAPRRSMLLSNENIERYLWQARELLSSDGYLPNAPDSGQLVKAGIVFSDSIWGLYGNVYASCERPERDLIRKFATVKQYDAWARKHVRLLKQGFTMDELTRALVPEVPTDEMWYRSVVSLGIDSGNDLGIIVPITVWDRHRDLVYRAYRVGESAPIAATPLADAVAGDRQDFDEVTRAALATMPIHSETIQIADTRHPTSTKSQPSELANKVRRALPSPMVDFLLGVITDVADDAFVAEVASTSGHRQGVATVPTTTVRPVNRARIVEGAIFAMTSFEATDDSDAHTRIHFLGLNSSPR